LYRVKEYREGRLGSAMLRGIGAGCRASLPRAAHRVAPVVRLVLLLGRSALSVVVIDMPRVRSSRSADPHGSPIPIFEIRISRAAGRLGGKAARLREEESALACDLLPR
jgi:hypothetical protein